MSQQVLAQPVLTPHVRPRHPLAQRAIGAGLRLVTHRGGGLPRIGLGLLLIGSAVPKLAAEAGCALGSLVGGGAAAAAIERVTFGLVTGHAALVTSAVLEVLIGLLLLSGRAWRVGAVLLAGALVATVSPLLVFVDHVLAWPAARTALGIADTTLACVAMMVTACALVGNPDQGRS